MIVSGPQSRHHGAGRLHEGNRCQAALARYLWKIASSIASSDCSQCRQASQLERPIGRCWPRSFPLEPAPLSLDLEAYYALVQPSSSGILSLEQSREWQALISSIVIGESYLFRDSGQFELLERNLLPAIITARRHIAGDASKRLTLKIWSAGCSTGEEIYSIALVLNRILPSHEKWDLQLVGTDINPNFLAIARQATYGNWSFRQVPPEIREHYFQPAAKNRWQLLPRYRKLVRFERGNLLSDKFATPLFQDCDLIICRNVFIYFETAAIARVLETFQTRLRPGGFLLCGHAELRDCDTSQLKTHLFPESVVYQRQDGNEIAAITPPSWAPPVPPPPSQVPISPPRGASLPLKIPSGAEPALNLSQTPILKPENVAPSEPSPRERAEAYLQAGDLPTALAIAEGLPQAFALLLEIARGSANFGQLELAERASHLARQQDPDAIAPLQLLAHIFEEKGDLVTAKHYWRQVIYLKPQAIFAYLELAGILQREGNAAGADRQRATARELLSRLSPTQTIDCGFDRPELTAAQLLRQLAP